MKLRVSEQVQDAIRAGSPVVALESTVIAHGLPYPKNLEVARALEETVRAQGCTPATVAVLNGIPRVGLADEDLEYLATAEGVRKLSRRDLGIAIARRANGATTVAATMVLAARAGIAVFATGGIGGVHRGPGHDISADLPELARTPMVVVCSGAKAILDLPATREWLETYGVPVLGYGTDEFPAFYAASSGLPVDERVDTAGEVALIARTLWEGHLGTGLLVTVPPPAEAAMGMDEVERAVSLAVEEAQAQSVRGRDLTPYLLNRIAQLTGGHSLGANLALLRNNAAVAAQIARELAS